MNPPPVSLRTTRPGIVESILLLIGAGFAALMFDLPVVAIACGSLALLAWAFATLRGPRPFWKATLALGGGLVVTYMWWPADDWSPIAITLMWIGVALVVLAAVQAYLYRRTGPHKG